MPDTTTAEQAVADAVREAQAAQRDFLALEHAALHDPPGSRPDAARVLAQRQEAEHAAQRVEVARDRLEAARTAARLAALEQLGTEVDALAAGASSSPAISGAVNALKLAAGQLRAAAAEHDAQVADLRKRIGAWKPKPSRERPHGPSAADAWVGLTPASWGRAQGGVRHQDTAVTAVSEGVGRAIELACAGEVKAALAEVAAVHDTSPRQPDGYVLDTLTRTLMPFRGQPARAWGQMIEEGRGVRMTPAQADAYREGQSS